MTGRNSKSNRKIKKIIYIIIHNLPIYEIKNQHFLKSELPVRDFMFHARFANRIILAVPTFTGDKGNFKVPLRHMDNKIEVVRYSQKNKIAFCISIYRIIQSGNVIHYGWKKSFLVGLIAIFLRKKRVLVLDADPVDEIRIASQNPYYSYAKRYSIKLYSLLLKIYLACSGRLANVILSVGKGPTVTLKKLGLAKRTWLIIASNIFLHDVVSREILYKKYQRDKNMRIVVAAQFRYKKGIHVVLKALELLTREAQLRYKVDIIGSGPFKNTIKKLARPLEGIVKFKSPIPYGKDFYSYLDQYQILIVPQLSNEQPRIILDGMARGLLVIASDTLGNKTIISSMENGLLYKRTDPVALKNILKKVLAQYLRNPLILAEIPCKGIEFAKRYTVDAVHAKRDKLLIKELKIC